MVPESPGAAPGLPTRSYGCVGTDIAGSSICVNNKNNNNTIWGGSVLTLKHALPQAGGPTQSQLSRPKASGHHISMEHRLRRKHLLLNPDTNARKGIKSRKHFFKRKRTEKGGKKREEKKGGFFYQKYLTEIVTKLRT